VFQSLLSPIGQYRAANTTPSKGKRSKKRKREEKKSKPDDPALPKPSPPEISSFVVVGLNSITRSLESLSQKSRALRSVDCEKNDAAQEPLSPAFEIKNEQSNAGQISQREASASRHQDLNAIEEPLHDAGEATQPQTPGGEGAKSAAVETSHSLVSGAERKDLNKSEKPCKDAVLINHSPISQKKSKKSRGGLVSPATKARDKTARVSKEPHVEEEYVDRHFAAIFIPRSSQPPILHAHLPQLVVTASLASPELPATRMVQLPGGCDARLAEALGLPRVSFVGILDGAPHSKSLVDLVRECVPEVEIPWLDEAKNSVYLPVKINAIESFVPVAKKESNAS
jgi:RNase P subunit Pop3